MALKHAVLAALLTGELSGYQLAKAFDVGVANFWHALPQQLYAELGRLEHAGLIEGREVVQDSRPNKRLFTVTESGHAALQAYVDAGAKPSFMRDDLVVMVHAVDGVDPATVVERLDERKAFAEAKIRLFDSLLDQMRGDRSEDDFLATSDRIGPFLTCLRGRTFERENADWCDRAASIIKRRNRIHA
ncbi:PadR family transcriptional regulator [Luteipulveratus halotolerans]|uniref:PadR family transcriptional regulator n=1 Tax=Luteipulveratus halotolerans TaxID=1631356 RepID=A0A0L6CPE9_9MICO|nr:PadR family transcriptional regulator [Luteipulveratus halotolerans]KNX39607.1 PadR family transcriptional regulator [Luteipulveratus halotolerans]